MPTMKNHKPGTFCWAELATQDPAKAAAFYGELLGWSKSESPLPDGRVYTTFLKNGSSVGAAFKMGNQYPPGTPPHWSVYISVSDVDAVTKKASSAGAKVIAEPFDVMEYGRMSTVVDPTGGTISFWQPKKHAGFELIDDEGAPCWFELMTRDSEKARGFYEKVLGWKYKLSPDYAEIEVDGKPLGGIFPMRPEMSFPPMWAVYFHVKDINSYTERVKTLGGSVMMGPQQIPGTGWFSVVGDSTGAVFNLYQKA